MSNKQKTAYIFRGAPASGKGATTQSLVKKLPGKVALLDQNVMDKTDASEVKIDVGKLTFDQTLELIGQTAGTTID